MQSELRKADLVRIKPKGLAFWDGRDAPAAPESIGIVMDVYTQPQSGKTFVQVLISETINWYPEAACELVQRGSYVVQ